MAKPRVFVSSTYYDFKYIRASLDIFIEEFGYESILSEKGDIAYTPDLPLDESCYKEVENVDIFILIVGGRYGSESSSGDRKKQKGFYDRYESITKKEYEKALELDIPTYILAESNVYSEYRTYLKNKGNQHINYAHVDSVNIFKFLEDILSQPRNNPVFAFEKFDQVEGWLKEQWAGLFRELLKRKTQQSQLKTLTSEITELQEVNRTLKTYLEAVMSGITPDDSTKLIEKEKERLRSLHIRKELEANKWFEWINRDFNIDFESFLDIQLQSKSFDDFIDRASDLLGSSEAQEEIKRVLVRYVDARADLNKSREVLGLKPFKKLPKDESTTHNRH